MKRYFALILLLTASTLFSGCRGSGSSAPAPTNVQVVEGDSSVNISWDMAPGVEYWIFKAAATDLTPQNCYPLPECGIIINAVSPRVVSGLTNGTNYSFTINGRTGGGKGGAGSPSISKVPRLAGSTWTAGSPQGTSNLYGIGFGSVFVAAGDTGALFSSSDGINWTALSSAVTTKLNAVSYYTGTYLVAGAGGVILRSTDAATWTPQTSGTTNDLYAVSNHGTAGYAATGASGTILYSGDGATWTASTPITANPLYGVTYGNGIYVAVGAAGTLLSSVDAVTWTPLTSNTANTLQGIAYAPPAIGTTSGGTFVAVGANGTVVRSADGGATWATVTSPISPTTVINSVTYGRQFIAVADDGTIYTSTDGLTWTLAQTATAPLHAVTHGLFDYTAVGASGLNMHSM